MRLKKRVKNKSGHREWDYRLSTRHLINLSVVFAIVKKSSVRKFNDAFLIAFACGTKIYSNETKLFYLYSYVLAPASRRVNKNDVQFYLFVSFVNCHPRDTWHQYKFNWRHKEKSRSRGCGKNTGNTLAKPETYVWSTQKGYLHE